MVTLEQGKQLKLSASFWLIIGFIMPWTVLEAKSKHAGKLFCQFRVRYLLVHLLDDLTKTQPVCRKLAYFIVLLYFLGVHSKLLVGFISFF